jgi:hypothetical protein
MRKNTKIGLAGLTLISLGAAAVLVAHLVFAAGTASLSLTPASGTFSQGATVNVNIYEDSGSDTVNAVQANFSYPASMLTFTGITNSSAFGVDAQSTGGGGNVNIARGATTAVAGNQLVATVHFTVSNGGTANLNFTGGSAVVRSTDNGAESLTTNGASYNLISPATMNLSPATKTMNVGDSVSVSIYENSGGTAVNAVQADLNYPTSYLTFVSIDPASSSAFTVDAQATGGNGSVKIGRGTTTPVTGNQLVGVVHFTAKAAGTASITFAGTTALIRSSDNGAESLTNTGAAYTISAPSSGGSSGGGGSSSSKPPASSSSSSSSSNSSSNNSSSSSSSNSQTPQPPVTTNQDNNAPVISKVQVTNLSLNTATVSWQTSEAASSEVDYGLSTKYSLSITDPKLTTNHSVVLNSRDLVGHKTYHYRVKSVDAAGNQVVSKDYTFTTEPVSSKAAGFWAATAAIVVIGAGAVVGANYIKRMRNMPPPGPSASAGGSTGGSAGPSSNIGGGAVVKPDGSVVKPDTSSKTVVISPSANKPVPPPA